MSDNDSSTLWRINRINGVDMTSPWMIKADCEQAVRRLCHEWRNETGQSNSPADRLSFEQFLLWLRDTHPDCLRFRTTTSVRYDIEEWFDQELNKIWRRGHNESI